MPKILYIILLFASMLSAIEIDVPYLKKQIASSPKDTTYRMILAKYYTQNFNYADASKYINQIMKIDPKNARARQLQAHITKFRNIQSQLHIADFSDTSTLEKHLHQLIETRQYETFINLYETLSREKIFLNQNIDLDAATAYCENHDIHQCKLQLKIKDFSESAALLAIKIDLTLAENNLEKAQKLFSTLQKEYPNDPHIQEINQKIKQNIQKRTQHVAAKLQTSASPQALHDYVYLLENQKKPGLAEQAVSKFLQSHPGNFDARLLLVKLLYWHGKLDRAFHALYPFRLENDETKMLYTNILYEKGDYQHALYYLPGLVKKSKSGIPQYNLEKRMAFAYLYTGQKAKANTIFNALLKQHPKDREISQLKEEIAKQSLLQSAVKFYQQKEYDKSLHFYKEYYTQHKDPKIAREIAEIYYFDKKYDQTIPYFQYYLDKYPDDETILFHLASVYEKKKVYHKSIPLFYKITQNPNSKLLYLAEYHYSHNLMQMQKEKEWIKARKSLKILHTQLLNTTDPKLIELRKYSDRLLKTALGPVLKPTRYKDIVLTEGSYKRIHRSDVFSDIAIVNTTKPSLKTLLHITPDTTKIKPTLALVVDYAKDSEVSFKNYHFTINDFLVANGIRYSVDAQKFYFDTKHTKEKGHGVSLSARKNTLAVSLGIEQFDTFNTLIPKITWSPTFGMHDLYMQLYYTNAALLNYRTCTIKNKTNVLHAGIDDRILLENLNHMDLSFNLNAYEDHNINIYGLLNYPIYTWTALGMEHGFYFNENIDYNSKTDVCYTPAKMYDSSYLKYKPKFTFRNGTIAATIGAGYSLKQQERIYSYGIQGDYTIKGFATLELNCERMQSSITTDDIDYCTFNIIQAW